MRQRSAQFLIRFDEAILNKLRKVAKGEGRTTTELIREAVAELLGDRERQNPKRVMKQPWKK